MPTVTGQADAPNEAGISGIAFPQAAPGMQNVGVKGDGGATIDLPTTVPVFASAVGVLGTAAGAKGIGVEGLNSSTAAKGLLGCEDPVFRQHAGVFG